MEEEFKITIADKQLLLNFINSDADAITLDIDFNLLMQIIEKITSILMLDDNYKYNYLYIGYDFEDKEHYVNLYVSEDIQLNGFSKNSKKEAIYKAVIKFINFYNKQKEE